MPRRWPLAASCTASSLRVGLLRASLRFGDKPFPFASLAQRLDAAGKAAPFSSVFLVFSRSHPRPTLRGKRQTSLQSCRGRRVPAASLSCAALAPPAKPKNPPNPAKAPRKAPATPKPPPTMPPPPAARSHTHHRSTVRAAPIANARRPAPLPPRVPTLPTPTPTHNAPLRPTRKQRQGGALGHLVLLGCGGGPPCSPPAAAHAAALRAAARAVVASPRAGCAPRRSAWGWCSFAGVASCWLRQRHPCGAAQSCPFRCRPRGAARFA